VFGINAQKQGDQRLGSDLIFYNFINLSMNVKSLLLKREILKNPFRESDFFAFSEYFSVQTNIDIDRMIWKVLNNPIGNEKSLSI
jgi:hypothetical protein